MKVLLLLVCCLSITLSQDAQAQSQDTQPQSQALGGQIILSVGQIFPGKIEVDQSKQNMHYLQIGKLQKKYLFIRINTYDQVKMAIGLYLNQTRSVVYACQENVFDSCYVPIEFLKQNTMYVVLIVANNNMQYNLYSYWGDLEHLKPNQQIKFMFDKTNPTQLFHLQFKQKKDFQQIRIILKPQTARSQGDTVKIFANLGFKTEPTAEKYDYISSHVWGQAQAIFLSRDDVKNQTGIAIYIAGSAQTVYLLQCQFVQSKSHLLQINQTLNEYLGKKKQTYYEMNFTQYSNIDSYVIKFSVFIGELEIQFYYDKQFTKPYSKLPYQYMSDMQFNIDRNDFINGTKQIYMRVRCTDSPAVYQISTQARSKQLAFELHQNVYQFSALVEQKQAMYFYSHIWDTSSYEQLKIYKFDISTIKIFGMPIFQFYICKAGSSEQDCKNINDKTFMNHVEKIKPTGIEEVGSKIIHTIQFNQSVYKTINKVEKQLMVIILVRNQGNGTTAYAAQYSNPNKIRMLREGRAFQDKVRIQQKKYYKYLNNNPNVTQIRIHVNQISGLSKVRAKRSDIRETGGDQIYLSKEQPDTIVIKQRVTQPVYIQVHGLVTTLYTIAVSAIHSQHIISNALIMAQDVEYQVKLLPYQHMNIQLHPIQSEIVFEFYSEGGSVMVCQVDDRDTCIGDKLAGSHGEIKINAASSRQVRMRIGNYMDANLLTPNAKSNQNQHLPELVRKVKLTLMYHGAGLTHCDQRKLNKVYSENVKSGSCFKFHLPLASDIEIMTSRSDLGQTFQMFFLCSKKITPIQTNNRYIVKSDIIRQSCQQLPHDINLQMIISDSGKNAPQLKLEYSVQYGNDTITLADGVAYLSSGYSNAETALRTFFYEVLDEDRDINIVLYNKKGIQKFYANLANKPNRYSGFVSEGQAKFSSKNSNYYTNPYIKITPNDIQEANCGRTCVLILSVFSIEKTGTDIQYAIQVTQNHIYLKEDQIKKGYLSKGSVEFYQYQSKSATGSLIFLVSDNNRKCARSLMSKNPFPTSSNYFVKQNQGTLIYDKSQKGTYYFAVEAVEDCPYTVSVTQGNAKITKIQFGQFYDIKLEQGQQKWFYTRRVSHSSFKVITLKKYGQVDIFVNRTDLSKQAINDIENAKVDKSKFAFKSSYKNTLVVDSKSQQFCSNCYYLININAKKATEGSIYLGGDNSKILMSEDKILFDEISTKDATTYATFYRVSAGKLQVKVHLGKIKFQMSYSSQKFSKSFLENKKVYHEDYNFTKEDGNYQPIQIRITAETAPALYSFELDPAVDASVTLHKINPGEHTYIFLKRDQQQCLTGTLTSSDQQIYISTQPSQADILSSLVLSSKIDGVVTTNIQNDLVGNILSLKFKHQSVLFIKPKNFSICMRIEGLNETSSLKKNTTSKESKSFSSAVSLFAFQNQNVNLIHPDTQVLVKNQSTFVLYSSSDVIVDLFECRGKAQIYYASNLQKIKQKQSHKLDTIGIAGQNHAIRISQYSTLFFAVKAELATVLWMPLIEKEQRGIGYYKYAIGGLEYHSQFNNIQFKIGGVYRAKDTETTVKSIKYTLFISNTKQQLQQAVMCQKNAISKFVFASVNTSNVGNRTAAQISISMDKKRITDTFSENQTLYFNVVADVTLEPPKKKQSEQQNQDNHEHYRFVYNSQIVPSQVFRQNKIQSMQLTLLIVLAVVTVIGFVLISCIFVRCIIPALGRLKNRVLVEEKEDPKDQSIPIPPSSDRGQRETGAPGTEDKMNE